MFVQLKSSQCCFMVVAVTFTFAASIEPTRYKLVHYLLYETDYDKNFPPNTENVTNVSVQLTITDLNSKSDLNREIEFTLLLRMNWTDQRLEFTKNKTSYEVITFGDDLLEKIWIPDLYFIQERKSLLHGLLGSNQLIYIHKNGSIFYSGRFNIQTHCVMNFDKYPFDTQTCQIEIQSYAYTTDLLLLHWYGDDAVSIKSTSDPLRLEKPAQKYSIESRDIYIMTGEFSSLKTEIVVTRPEGSYLIAITGPPVLLFLSSLCTFLLGETITLRITLPMASLVALFVQWSGIYSRISLDSTLDSLDTWMQIHFFSIWAILIVNVLIIYFIYRKVDKDKKDKEIIWKFVKCIGSIYNRCQKSKHGTKKNNERNGILSAVHQKMEACYGRGRCTSSNKDGSISGNDNKESETGKPMESESEEKQYLLKFHDVKKMLDTDERYKRAKNMFGVEGLEKWYRTFIKEKTEQEFKDLLEENRSLISQPRCTKSENGTKRNNKRDSFSSAVVAYNKGESCTSTNKDGSNSEKDSEEAEKGTLLEKKEEGKFLGTPEGSESEETHYLMKFHEGKENLDADERYKKAKTMFGEKELEEWYRAFIKEETKQEFKDLLEENRSLISTKNRDQSCCCSNRHETVEFLVANVNFFTFFLLALCYSIAVSCHHVRWKN